MCAPVWSQGVPTCKVQGIQANRQKYARWWGNVGKKNPANSTKAKYNSIHTQGCWKEVEGYKGIHLGRLHNGGRHKSQNGVWGRLTPKVTNKVGSGEVGAGGEPSVPEGNAGKHSAWCKVKL